MHLYIGGQLSNSMITEVKVKNGVRTVDDFAFLACPRISRIVLPNSVKSIGSRALHGLEDLEAIILPDSVNSIGPGAFALCKSLREIKIPEGVTEIGEKTFLSCKSLERIKLPNSLTKIGVSAFSGCEALEQVDIPNGVKVIPKEAFLSCRSLRTATLPAPIEEFGTHAFCGCRNLQTFILPNGLPALKYGFNPIDLTTNGITQILENASGLTKFDLQNQYLKDDDLPRILRCVSDYPTLPELDLSGNHFSVGVFENLASLDIPDHLRLLKIKGQCQVYGLREEWIEASSSPQHLLRVLERNPKLVIETGKFWDDRENDRVCHHLDMSEYGCRGVTLRDSCWPKLIETLAVLEEEGKLRTRASNIMYHVFHRQLNVLLDYPQDNSSMDNNEAASSAQRARLE